MNVSGHTFKVYFITLHHAVSHTATRASQCETSAHHTQEGNEGKQGGHNSPGTIPRAPIHYYGGAESLRGWQITTGAIEKSQQCHKYFLQYTVNLLSKKLMFHHEGAKLRPWDGGFCLTTGAPNLFFAPGAIQPRYAPGRTQPVKTPIRLRAFKRQYSL